VPSEGRKSGFTSTASKREGSDVEQLDGVRTRQFVGGYGEVYIRYHESGSLLNIEDGKRGGARINLKEGRKCGGEP